MLNGIFYMMDIICKGFNWYIGVIFNIKEGILYIYIVKVK